MPKVPETPQRRLAAAAPAATKEERPSILPDLDPETMPAADRARLLLQSLADPRSWAKPYR